MRLDIKNYHNRKQSLLRDILEKKKKKKKNRISMKYKRGFPEEMSHQITIISRPMKFANH